MCGGVLLNGLAVNLTQEDPAKGPMDQVHVRERKRIVDFELEMVSVYTRGNWVRWIARKEAAAAAARMSFNLTVVN